MKFCKTCDKKLPKDETLDQCSKCISTEENEEGDFDNEERK